jgi:hypothetical protein
MNALALAILLAQDLTDKTYDRLRDQILPTKEEAVWKAIPWRSTLWDALVDAQKEDKPILIWAMNGHPLACT